uniref:C3H1-type domain-containing protein n=1 Tax=Chromera velia CCMP2878 TaxID=1169474 RepID=A0A0G4G0L2_9ALVE|eukprot:Cvel_19660.t1-p1 / transcript=Cvel_19660.t1 / gene=Cvel_19660 / organism=Chromera_velia_CCMP2878 / gene_product=hypothetical protein / transcript_product=hypothetical protein / location=Cvel_scaffold1714:1174-6463(+) / protein_length=820 / sequence_SO=supercontig / SO=protein_coding / is_pseudo=false
MRTIKRRSDQAPRSSSPASAPTILRAKCPLSADLCTFAHGVGDLKKPEEMEKYSLCRFWIDSGFASCPFGSVCRNAHGLGELKPRKYRYSEIDRRARREGLDLGNLVEDRLHCLKVLKQSPESVRLCRFSPCGTQLYSEEDRHLQSPQHIRASSGSGSSSSSSSSNTLVASPHQEKTTILSSSSSQQEGRSGSCSSSSRIETKTHADAERAGKQDTPSDSPHYLLRHDAVDIKVATVEETVAGAEKKERGGFSASGEATKGHEGVHSPGNPLALNDKDPGAFSLSLHHHVSLKAYLCSLGLSELTALLEEHSKAVHLQRARNIPNGRWRREEPQVQKQQTHTHGEATAGTGGEGGSLRSPTGDGRVSATHDEGMSDGQSEGSESDLGVGGEGGGFASLRILVPLTEGEELGLPLSLLGAPALTGSGLVDGLEGGTETEMGDIMSVQEVERESERGERWIWRAMSLGHGEQEGGAENEKGMASGREEKSSVLLPAVEGGRGEKGEDEGNGGLVGNSRGGIGATGRDERGSTTTGRVFPSPHENGEEGFVDCSNFEMRTQILSRPPALPPRAMNTFAFREDHPTNPNSQESTHPTQPPSAVTMGSSSSVQDIPRISSAFLPAPHPPPQPRRQSAETPFPPFPPRTPITSSAQHLSANAYTKSLETAHRLCPPPHQTTRVQPLTPHQNVFKTTSPFPAEELTGAVTPLTTSSFSFSNCHSLETAPTFSQTAPQSRRSLTNLHHPIHPSSVAPVSRQVPVPPPPSNVPDGSGRTVQRHNQASIIRRGEHRPTPSSSTAHHDEHLCGFTFQRRSPTRPLHSVTHR